MTSHSDDKLGSFSFSSFQRFRTVMTPKRMELINSIRVNHPDSIYALAKLVHRSVENVHTDVQILNKEGLVSLHRKKDIRKKSTPSLTFDHINLDIDLSGVRK
ncbi:MAG: HVO_A0114 family putative DNA-binding protein [Candidatus Thorarchaeota archaeon]